MLYIIYTLFTLYRERDCLVLIFNKFFIFIFYLLLFVDQLKYYLKILLKITFNINLFSYLSYFFFISFNINLFDPYSSDGQFGRMLF